MILGALQANPTRDYTLGPIQNGEDVRALIFEIRLKCIVYCISSAAEPSISSRRR